MPVSPRKRLLAAALILAALIGIPLALAVDGARSLDRTGLILSRLPSPAHPTRLPR